MGLVDSDLQISNWRENTTGFRETFLDLHTDGRFDTIFLWLEEVRRLF